MAAGTLLGMNEQFEAFRVPATVRVGDKVAVLSPSRAGPGVSPAVHEIGMRVLREDLGLLPVEYPTTRRVDAPAGERAADLMAALADPTIRAVLVSIGGDDQIIVLPHLGPAVFPAGPKPFVGNSDNTNLLNWLWNLGSSATTAGRRWCTWPGRAAPTRCPWSRCATPRSPMTRSRSSPSLTSRPAPPRSGTALPLGRRRQAPAVDHDPSPVVLGLQDHDVIAFDEVHEPVDPVVSCGRFTWGQRHKVSSGRLSCRRVAVRGDEWEAVIGTARD